MLRQRRRSSDAPSENAEEENAFKALYILIFQSNASEETVSWILDLLTRSQREGGGELLVRVTHTENEGIIVEIGASHSRLFEGAETLEITKEDNHGVRREFIISNLYLFLKPGMTFDSLLSTAEKQRIIYEIIIGLRSMELKKLTGYPDITLHPGQSILQVCKDYKIISHMYPLHEPPELELLKNQSWNYSSFPLRGVQNYFGESITFYFAFICFYTSYLWPTAIAGIIQTVISMDISRCYIFFAIFKMIWVTLFLENWKRKSNELAYIMGTLKLINIPKLHPTFRGLYMDQDPVTKQRVPVYPAYRRHLKVYCVSLPIIGVCLVLAVCVMLFYFQVEECMYEEYTSESLEDWVMTQSPGIFYAILVYIMNIMYGYLANILTEWENHKTQESFDNHRIVKLLLFESVNNFIAMGYIAFYQQNLSMLKGQILIMMVVNQLFNQFQEAVLPFLIQKFRRMWRSSPDISPRIRSILDQRDMWAYEGTYDDYLEMFTQFGYVFLFSSVFPLAALLALLNNLLEVWVDGFKLCYAYQRPQARPVKGIGVWQVAFEALSLLSVMSNCALISMSPMVRSYAPNMSVQSWMLVVVAIEHIIIAVKMILAYSISDVPKWVSVSLQKAQFESLQVLKTERKERTNNVLRSLNIKNVSKVD